RELVSGGGEAGRTARLIASLRLPRVLLASLVGGCLAMAGAALQALLKNPLADPFLLGTSCGAAVGAAAAALAGAAPLISSASPLTGSDVAFAGVIGCVGLLVPHAVRAVVGNDQRGLLPLSAIAGAALVVVAYAVSRSVLAPAELPIGAITAAIGAPLFAWL